MAIEISVESEVRESGVLESEVLTGGYELSRLDWWRPCGIRFVGEVPASSLAVAAFLEDLRAAFELQGHAVDGDETVKSDVTVACVEIPDGPEQLGRRIVEERYPLLMKLRKASARRGGIGHLVAVAEVPERLSTMSHVEVVQVARTLMSRAGAPKVLFVTRGELPGEVLEVTFCTMEGGHPSDRVEIAGRVCDRIITAACATEVAGRCDVETDAITAADWAAARVPRALAAAGRRMGGLSLLPAPQRLGDYVSQQLAVAYEKFLGLKGFSEGMLFAYDPELEALVVTASGTYDVDKRFLTREDVVAVEYRLNGGRLRILAPVGVTPKGPSVEAWEVCALLAAAPRVRVSRNGAGQWEYDPGGEREVPAIRGGLHAHVGVSYADPELIETIVPDRSRFPYGFGCGTDLMIDVAQATIGRSSAIWDLDDGRAYVRWPMLYHGEMAVEVWRDGLPGEPLKGLLDLFDPLAVGAVRYDADHIDQPV